MFSDRVIIFQVNRVQFRSIYLKCDCFRLNDAKQFDGWRKSGYDLRVTCEAVSTKHESNTT